MNEALASLVKRRVSIPEYFKKYINPTADLLSNPKQCCPFHKEDTPSWSYSADRGVWSCFGACHVSGDVIELHRRHFDLESKEAALESLSAMYGIRADITAVTRLNFQGAEEEDLEVVKLLRRLELRASGPKDWVEIDEAMSYYESTADRLIRLRGLFNGDT